MVWMRRTCGRSQETVHMNLVAANPGGQDVWCPEVGYEERLKGNEDNEGLQVAVLDDAGGSRLPLVELPGVGAELRVSAAPRPLASVRKEG